MQVRFDQIPDEGLELDSTIEPAAFVLEEDRDHIRMLEDVHFKGKIAKSGTDAYLTGCVSVLVELSCSRCLDKFAFPLQCQVEVHYIRRPDSLAEEVELGREELDETVYEGEEIDIVPEIRDHLLLALPLKPLCKEDCSGMCPSCGANLNFERCECAEERENHPFGVLKGWKAQRQSTKER